MSLLVNALRCNNHNHRPPVWLMRQAGRYMPEYRAVREKYSFLEMCRQPEIAAAVTRLPVDRFGMDAAILFSDILVMVPALGLPLRFEEGAGPVIDAPMKEGDTLPYPSVEESLGYVRDAIRLLVPTLDVPLIGFCGAPFTVASYMIEGGTSRTFKKTKQWMLRSPQSFHHLLDHLARCSADYINMQIASGVAAVQIFDSWAHCLSPQHFREFSLPYMAKIIRQIHDRSVPVILFCRGSSIFADDLASIHPTAISIDWNGDMRTIRNRLPRIALQGNLDPDVLYAPLPTVKQETLRLLDSMNGDPGYIFNLGHGIHPDTPVEAVQVLVETIKTHAPLNV